MFDYLVESVAIAFLVGAVFGALLTLQLGHSRFKTVAQKVKDRD